MSASDRSILAIDSSTSTGVVAIGTADELMVELSLDLPLRGRQQSAAPRGGHSAALLPAIEHCLRSVGLSPGDLGAVVVGAGPGSFTGLRIAAATAKGIVHALEVPMFAYSSLLAIASQAWAAERPVCALLDARGRDVFAACYSLGEGVEVVRAPAATTVDAVLDDLTGVDPLFVGDGAHRHRELIEARGSAVGPRHFQAPRSAGLVWLATSHPEIGRVTDPAGWEPDYLRASGAERIAAARAEAQNR